jgi:hypothetical protein
LFSRDEPDERDHVPRVDKRPMMYSANYQRASAGIRTIGNPIAIRFPFRKGCHYDVRHDAEHTYGDDHGASTSSDGWAHRGTVGNEM